MSRVSKTESERPEKDKKMFKIQSLLMNRVQGFGPKLEQIRGHIARLDVDTERSSQRKRQKGVRPNTTSGRSVMMDDLITKLSFDGRGLTTSSGRNSPDSESENKEFGDQWHKHVVRLGEDLKEVVEATRLLISDVGLLKASAKDKSIKFGGLGLRTLQESNTWVLLNLPGLRHGPIMDPLLVLNRIFRLDDVEAESQFKVLESSVKLRITTGAEAAAMKALHFNRPRLFHKGRVAMTSERNTSKLSKLPNHKSRKSRGEGVRNYVTKQMHLIYSTLTHDIAFIFRMDPKLAQAQAVAT